MIIFIRSCTTNRWLSNLAVWWTCSIVNLSKICQYIPFAAITIAYKLMIKPRSTFLDPTRTGNSINTTTKQNLKSDLQAKKWSLITLTPATSFVQPSAARLVVTVIQKAPWTNTPKQSTKIGANKIKPTQKRVIKCWKSSKQRWNSNNRTSL